MSDTLLYEKKGAVAVVTINRPQKVNCMDGTVYDGITRAVEDYARDPNLRCMILTGAGGNFSSGGDLVWFRSQREKAKAEGKIFQYDFPTFKALDHLSKPVIAAIDGHCLASGFNMTVLHCDIRIATTRVKMGHPAAKRGLTSPGNREIYPMPYTWYMGLGNALYMMLTGKLLGPEEVLRFGLVNEVVEPDQLIPRCFELAEMIAEGSPRVLAAQKMMLRRYQEFPGAGYARLRELVYEGMDDSAYMEGTAAFLEKRKPDWNG